MEFMLDLAVSVVSLLVVGFYTWSLRGHFYSPKMATGAKLISAVVIATTLFFLYLAWYEHQVAWVQIVGLVIEICAAALFWWAVSASRKARLRFAFDPDHPDSIVTTGPYRYLRHPFYTSYLMFWSGWAIASSSTWAVVPVIAFVIIYVSAALGEEKKFSKSPLAPEYEAYRRKTGFLIPRFDQR
ncbi:isoprenylcysteine carboxylmethyltransferase family protein [Rhizobium sp. BK376]|uniref:methyltransferase family protein n=1 Tax=Rhizobium sp. BK376 TaxID=2512149 RepID=UPI00104F46F2|nr:isoprenylcysteine carboxylmethyltransferase family protein [Rhizobium sp. BK376]TCR79100.1 protein-S-isoprenylcysteine O-methyltransferase Ste14 [Rhizobium sp. BK376]